MSYKSGAVKLSLLPKELPPDNSDAYFENLDAGLVCLGSEREAYLPHSCNEWVIGGKAEVQQLITDLQELLEKWPG